jgi:hypothetical protein
MGEAKAGEDQDLDGRGVTSDRDPGAFIGHEPELAAERIPGGVHPQDERVAATQSEPAAEGEPDETGAGTDR